MSAYRFYDVDRYDTPENHPVSLLFRLLGKNRFYFYFKNFGIYCKSGREARRGKLDKECQIRNSNGNFDLVERCGGRIHLRGLENLRAAADEPVIVIANHMSLLESAVLHAIIRGYVDFSFVVKDSLMRTPFLRDILKSFNAVPLSRSNPRADLRAIMTLGKEVINSKRSLIVFPQATRNEEFHPEKFSSIGVKLARVAGARILPMALKTDFIGNGRGVFKDIGPVRPEREVWFEFAPLLTVEGNGQKQQNEIIDFIASRVEAWRALDRKKDAVK